MRVVGAGLGRTGTSSLKHALTRLLGGPCYHMIEVFQRPGDIPQWHAAARGDMPDFRALLADFRAAVDWPASAFWEELADIYPDAIILLSTRDSASWWASASETIFAPHGGPGHTEAWDGMVEELLTNRFAADRTNRDECIAAFERHNAHVRATAPADRLVEWTATDGWGPLCKALGVAVPNEPFPRANTREDWRARNAGH